MSAKMHKKARAYAYTEASRRNLWAKGTASFYGKWWRKLMAWLFPKTRKRYTDAIGRWYKATLKAWSHAIAESFHDPDRDEFIRARRRIAKTRKAAVK